MIKVFGTGRMTKDPEVLQTNGNKMITKFTLAFDDGSKDKDGNRISYFVDCVAFENRADYVAKYCHKGNLLAIDGNLRIESYTAKDGTNRKATRVAINNVENLSPREDNTSAPKQEAPTQAAAEPTKLVNDDDLPF